MRRNSFRYYNAGVSFDFTSKLKDMFNTRETLPNCYEVSTTTISQLEYLNTPKHNMSLTEVTGVIDLCKYLGISSEMGGVVSISSGVVASVSHLLWLSDELRIDVNAAICNNWPKISYAEKMVCYAKYSDRLPMHMLDCMPDDLSEIDYSFTCQTCHLHKLVPCKTIMTTKDQYIYSGKVVTVSKDSPIIDQEENKINILREGDYMSYGGKSEVVCRDVGHIIVRLLRRGKKI